MTYLAIVLGDQASGKSSLIARGKYNDFDVRYRNTIGVESFFLADETDETALRLEILDTAGEPRYKAYIVPNYHRAKIFVYCIDLTKPVDKDGIKRVIAEFKDNAPNAPIILVGTKSDAALPNNIETLTAFAGEQRYQKTFITSAKNNVNVVEFIAELSKIKHKEHNSVIATSASDPLVRAIAVDSVNEDSSLSDPLHALAKGILVLEAAQQHEIGLAAEKLMLGLQQPGTVQNKQEAIELFQSDCNAIILAGDDSVTTFSIENTLNLVATVAIVALVILIASLVGFGIGFLAGAWTGPGAFISGVIGGSVVAVGVVGGSVGLGLGAGALASYGIFTTKISPEQLDVLDAVSEVAAVAMVA